MQTLIVIGLVAFGVYILTGGSIKSSAKNNLIYLAVLIVALIFILPRIFPSYSNLFRNSSYIASIGFIVILLFSVLSPSLPKYDPRSSASIMN